MNKKRMTIEDVEQILGYKVELVKKETAELSEIKVGECFILYGFEFIALAKSNVCTFAILKEKYDNSIFDSSTNRYENSVISRIVSRFEKELSSVCVMDGKSITDITCKTSTSLKSLDGRTDYGEITSRASLLTFDQYRDYVDILDQYKISDPWFLVTPTSTVENGCAELVSYISKSNCVHEINIRTTCAVRPTLSIENKTIVQVIHNLTP